MSDYGRRSTEYEDTAYGFFLIGFILTWWVLIGCLIFARGHDVDGMAIAIMVTIGSVLVFSLIFGILLIVTLDEDGHPKTSERKY